MNRTIKLLLFSDLFLITGAGLIDPILAIFIKEQLTGATVTSVGIAIACFFVTKAIIQLPFSRYVDAHDRKALHLIIGTFGLVMVPIMYYFITHIYTMYAVQVFRGLAAGIASPCWLGLWSTHLDKHHESFEWSLFSTTIGLGIAVAGAVGAFLADHIGFRPTFIIYSIMALIGWFILWGLDWKAKKDAKVKDLQFHSKRKLEH